MRQKRIWRRLSGGRSGHAAEKVMLQQQAIGAGRVSLALTLALPMDHCPGVHVAVGVSASAIAVRCFALAGAHPRAELCAGFFFVSHGVAMMCPGVGRGALLLGRMGGEWGVGLRHLGVAAVLARSGGGGGGKQKQ